MEKINELTPEQKAQIPIYAEKWAANGLSTEPVGVQKVEEVLQRIYKAMGYAPLQRVIKLSSPMAFAIAHPIAAALYDFLHNEEVCALQKIVYDGVLRQILDCNASLNTDVSLDAVFDVTIGISEGLKSSLKDDLEEISGKIHQEFDAVVKGKGKEQVDLMVRLGLEHVTNNIDWGGLGFTVCDISTALGESLETLTITGAGLDEIYPVALIQVKRARSCISDTVDCVTQEMFAQVDEGIPDIADMEGMEQQLPNSSKFLLLEIKRQTIENLFDISQEVDEHINQPLQGLKLTSSCELIRQAEQPVSQDILRRINEAVGAITRGAVAPELAETLGAEVLEAVIYAAVGGTVATKYSGTLEISLEAVGKDVYSAMFDQVKRSAEDPLTVEAFELIYYPTGSQAHSLINQNLYGGIKNISGGVEEQIQQSRDNHGAYTVFNNASSVANSGVRGSTQHAVEGDLAGDLAGGNTRDPILNEVSHHSDKATNNRVENPIKQVLVDSLNPPVYLGAQLPLDVEGELCGDLEQVDLPEEVKNAQSRLQELIGEKLSPRALARLVQDKWSDYLGGNLWSGYPAYAEYFRKELGLDFDNNALVQGYIDLAKTCGWWYGNQVFAMCVDRPEVIHMEDGRLHHPTELAIKWRNGWGLAFWRGTRIPEKWLKEKPSAAEVLQIDNVEVRRSGCELIGWATVLDELNAKMVDSHPNPEVGDLYVVDLPGSPGEKFLRVLCGTGREFALPVDPKCRTALEANMWTYGLGPDEGFIPEVRT